LDKSKKLTFIWEEDCKEGYKFLYEKMADKCKECGYASVCHSNLTAHRAYRVSKLRDKIVECRPYGRRARLVEVEEVTLEAAVRSESAIEGAVIKFQPQPCTEILCQHYERCQPAALKEGDLCKVVKVGNGFRCPKFGHRLIEVLLLLW